MSDSTSPRSPGQLIRTLLADRGWTQELLSTVTGIEQSAISRVAQDKRAIDAHLALLLSEAFEIPAEDFLDAQKAFDLARARAERVPDPARAIRAQLYARLPVGEMISRGWINAKSPKDAVEVEAALARFFGVASTEQIEVLPHAAKKTNVGADVSPAQLAWLYRVRMIAEELIVPRYSPAAVREALSKLAELRSSVENIRKVPGILAQSGIRFVIVESLAGAKIDGVCFWLNDMAPVIGLTLRYDRVDNFWFVLRHEIEHVLRGHGRQRPIIDTELEGERSGAGPTVPEEERVANLAASDFCVPREQMDRFYMKKEPFFMERDILGFAATLKLHPGLVVGQLQHRTGRYDRFRNHLAKIRHVVTPGTAADGWGDVYPVDSEPVRA